MATVPDRPQVNTTFQQNNGSAGYYINARTNLEWPYMSSSTQCSVAVSWSEGGTSFGSGSWAGSLIAYVGSTQQSGGQSSSSGANGSLTMTCSTPSSGAFTVRSDQTATVYANSNGAPPPSSFAMSQPTITFYINPTDKPITIIGTTNNYANSVQLVRLPLASSVIGRIFYVVNKDNTNLAGVCSYQGEAIDGFTTGSVRLPRWACIGLTPNGTGTSWNIMSYYGGTLPYMLTYNASFGSVMTEPHLVSRMTGNRGELPNPATWGKGNIASITTWQSVNSTATSTAVYARYFAQNPAGAYDGTTNRPYFYLQPSGDLSGNTNHNMSIFFVSDGTSWYIASVFTGAYCTFDNDVTSFASAPNLMTSNIALVGGSQYVSAPVGPTTSDNALMYYAKLTVTVTPSWGLFIHGNNNDTTRGPMGSTWNRVYKNNSTVNYSAFNMLQVKVTSVGLINFPLGMYPSQY